MDIAKIFRHGGSQAIRLPKAYRFDGTEVLVEKRGDEVILKPKLKPELKTLNNVACYMREKFPEGSDFPDAPIRPSEHERPILQW